MSIYTVSEIKCPLSLSISLDFYSGLNSKDYWRRLANVQES